MKILICCESESLREPLEQALEAAGHEVASGRDPYLLAHLAPEAGALLVEPDRARHAMAVLRSRGFAGRALAVGDLPPEELSVRGAESGSDGALTLQPTADLARRFALAVGGRRRVLVVDDSEIAARLLEEELAKAGFEASWAPDAQTATSLILKRATRPDLILLDINMPGVSGSQFCRFIKKNEMFRSIKVFFCSAADREQVAAAAAECGADGFILKSEILGPSAVERT